MSVSRIMAWVVWIIVSVFYSYQYVLRVMPNIMMTDITNHFHIDTVVYGQFSGIYYLTYSLVHLPVGIMLDKFGPRKVMTGCILLTVLGLLPLILADYWIYPLIGRALIGIGSSAAILGIFKIIRMTFEERYFSRMLGLSVMIGLIGAVYGGGPVSYMYAKWGYVSLVELFMLIGLLLALVTYFLIPESKESYQGTVLSNIKEVFTNSRVMMLCVFSGLMLGPLEGFADVWGSRFLKQIYGLSDAVASYLPSMIFLGMCFGSPIISIIAEKTGYYLGTIIAVGTAMLIVFIGLLSGVMSVTSMTLTLLLVGVCCAYQVIALYKVSTYVPESLSGLTTAVANMIIMSFGYLFHTIIGLVINLNGGPSVSQAFILGVSVIPIALVLGVIGFIILAYQENQSNLALKTSLA